MAPDSARRDPFENVPSKRAHRTPADAPAPEPGAARRDEERAEVDDAHGEVARFPEEDAELDAPHVGDVHGPVIGAKGEVPPSKEPRAADALVGFKQPPVRPREIQ